MLSQDDIGVLRTLIDRARRQGVNRPIPMLEAPRPDGAPDVYVAIAPGGGIPARAGTVPGVASCEVYKVNHPDGGAPALAAVGGLSVPVYNFGEAPVLAGVYCTVIRDKWGVWSVGGGTGGSVKVEKWDAPAAYPAGIIRFGPGFMVSNLDPDVPGTVRVDYSVGSVVTDWHVPVWNPTAGSFTTGRILDQGGSFVYVETALQIIDTLEIRNSTVADDWMTQSIGWGPTESWLQHEVRRDGGVKMSTRTSYAFGTDEYAEFRLSLWAGGVDTGRSAGIRVYQPSPAIGTDLPQFFIGSAGGITDILVDGSTVTGGIITAKGAGGGGAGDDGTW